MPDTPEELSLLDSLDGEWLKLPVPTMQAEGPAAQTLGAILRFTQRETYVPMGDISTKARLPLATVRKHIAALHLGGWINQKGRQPTRRGWPRRTCTIAITRKTMIALETTEKDPLTYGFLPWWACSCVGPWCARAVLSVVMSRLASLKAAVDKQDGEGLSADDLEGSIENMGGDDRFQFSLRWLTEKTGLDHKSVTKAKAILNHRFHIVNWQGNGQAKRGRLSNVTCWCLIGTSG